MRQLVCFCLAATFFLPACGRADETPSRPAIGSQINDFRLKDFRGTPHSLSELKADLVVVAFLGCECPLAKQFGPRLSRLAGKYQGRVAFLGINANSQDSISELANYARKHNITFPLLKDVGNRVADQLQAQRTPEVFLLDKKRKLRYWGRIDDQYGIGYARDKARKHFLVDGIERLLDGKEIDIKQSEPVGCHIGRVRKPSKDLSVTYSNQIARIFQKRCVECHRDGEVAPFQLTRYSEVAGWADTIAEVVKERRMPPWHATDKHLRFANDRHLSDQERDFILTWVRNGAPEGDPKQLPSAQQFVTGWQLPRKPDVIVPMRARPYSVPANGTVRYKYFITESGFKEDKWITAAQLLPGNRAVVHHILVFAIAPGERFRGGGARGFLFAYVPGMLSKPFPKGMAKRIRAGSRFVFQIHYTPVGSPQKDLSKLGLVIEKDLSKIRHEVKTTSAVRGRLAIPPRDGNHRVSATSPPQEKDGLLLGFLPHMHLRGKSFSYEARYSNGRRDQLLNVPAYDFNWQTNYRIAEPIPWPRGSRMYCVAHFDNSPDNPANPDPDTTVKWGNQTWEEMMIGYFDVATKIDAKDLKSKPAERPKASARTQALFNQLDKNKDGSITTDELSRLQRRIFKRVDANKDGKVTLSELEILDSIR